MSLKKRLILGVTFLWVLPLRPVLIFIDIPFLNDHLVATYFLSGLLGVVGMALLILPYYSESKHLEQKYRWVDKGMALSILLPFAFDISFLFIEVFGPNPYIGLSLLFFYIRSTLYAGIILLWVYGLAFSKGKVAVIAVLCFAALAYMPYPQSNNPELHQMMQELTNEEMEFLAPSAEDINAVAMSETDEIYIPTSVSSVVVVDYHGYMILLVAYTFMRFGRKEEEVLIEEPDENDGESLTPEDVQD